MRLGGGHLPRITKAKFETAQTDPQRFRHLADRDRRSAGAHQVFGFPNQARGGRGRLSLEKVSEVVRVRLKDQGAEKLLEVLPSMRCESKLFVVGTADHLKCLPPSRFNAARKISTVGGALRAVQKSPDTHTIGPPS